MKKNYRFIAPAIVLLSCTGMGCMALPESTQSVQQEAPKEQVRHGERLLKAFTENDANAFLSILPPELRQQFGDKEFSAARKSLTDTLGTPVSFQFDTQVEHPVLSIEVWKVRFRRTAQNDQTVYQEALFRVISGTVDGQSQIVCFNFL